MSANIGPPGWRKSWDSIVDAVRERIAGGVIGFQVQEMDTQPVGRPPRLVPAPQGPPGFGFVPPLR
eukprot:2277866-Rhodomonas_salina.2